MTAPIKVGFVFASPGIGGAERSMARLMASAHPHQLDCTLVLSGTTNQALKEMVEPIGVRCLSIGRFSIGDLQQILIQHPVDVVYLFGQIRTLWWARAARRAGVPVIVGAERGSGTRWINRIGRWIDRHSLDGYITNSLSTAGVLTDRIGIAKQRVFTIYNGIEVEDDSTLPEIGHSFTAPTIVCVANLRPLKGQIVLLRAVQQLRQEYPLLNVVLVGEDQTAGQFTRQAESEGLSDTYCWLGFQSDVRPILKRADLFVLPSLYREGMPTSIIEAMHASLPVIGTRVGGVSELIQDNQTGLVIEPNNADALISAIRRLLESEELRHRFGRAGRERVAKEFTMQSMVDRHVQVFGELLQSAQCHSDTVWRP